MPIQGRNPLISMVYGRLSPFQGEKAPGSAPLAGGMAAGGFAFMRRSMRRSDGPTAGGNVDVSVGAAGRLAVAEGDPAGTRAAGVARFVRRGNPARPVPYIERALTARQFSEKGTRPGTKSWLL